VLRLAKAVFAPSAACQLVTSSAWAGRPTFGALPSWQARRASKIDWRSVPIDRSDSRLTMVANRASTLSAVDPGVQQLHDPARSSVRTGP
jgi:hypothetical protein